MAPLQSSVSSSSSFSYGFTYHVFLSFRGSDTRYGFTGNLYKALSDKEIHTFIDNRELHGGAEITPSLFKAIEESRIFIPVMSINYAYSSFCLDELVHIIHCFKESGRLVLPIFYDVEPSHVRHQDGSYGKALAEHIQRFQNRKDSMERLKKWKSALTQTANFSGHHFNPRNEYEYQFIEKIVKYVSNKINGVPLDVPNYLVGLKSRVLKVNSFLDVGSNGEIQMLGIYGTEGMGKTTLARAVYNSIADQFDALCFLHDIRENSAKYGLEHLQGKLLSKLVKLVIKLGDVNEGIPIIKQRLHQKKVLLILDDVHELKQLQVLAGGLDWFGPGSRVIITTRDEQLLAGHGIERSYKVQELNDVDALEFLSRRFSRQDIVDPNYIEVLKRAVTYAGGNPSALDAIGLTLFGISVDECGYVLDGFERIPQRDFQKVFKALVQKEKDIFLDITCCFIGYDLTDVENILRAHYGHGVKYHIEMLINKSLINFSLDGKVTQNHLVERLAKDIVRRESKDPGRRSRLWSPEDIVQVLKYNMGSSKIEIIHLDSPLIEDEEEIEWDGEAFVKMPNLRILIIRKCHFSKAPKYLPKRLKVLEWWRYPSEELPSDFDSKQLEWCKLLKISHAVPKVSQTSQWDHVSQVMLQISHRVSQVMFLETTWRLVGLMSSVISLSCYALSPSFNRLCGKWKAFKFFLYGGLSLAILITMLFAKSPFSTRHAYLRNYTSFPVLMIISVYSFFYDRDVNGKPEILSIVSNAAFALVSLSLHKLINLWFGIGVFLYFLGCIAVQLLIINGY